MTGYRREQPIRLVASVITAIIFGLLFKILPDIRVFWSDVWIGAIVTTILFILGQILLGLYVSWGVFGSLCGAAGSIIVVMLLFYYSALILPYRAEFTHAYTVLYGSLKGAPLEETPRIS